MDAINPTMSTMDVAIVIGANNVVNPAAREVKSSPIYGMPIINVDEARSVFVLKRSMVLGFAGIENPLFLNRTPGALRRRQSQAKGTGRRIESDLRRHIYFEPALSASRL